MNITGPETRAVLPNLEAMSEAELAPSTPGVYMLVNVAGEVVYVGQSGDVQKRLAQHRKEGVKPFQVAQLYHITDLEARLRIEGILMLYYLPKYNRAVTLGLSDGKVWEMPYTRWARAPKKRRPRAA